MGEELRASCSVTQRIRLVKQPRGGFINPKTMVVESLGDGLETLNPEENVHASLVGLAVEYLTRVATGTSATDAFMISLMGAQLIEEDAKAQKLLGGIRGLDDTSIISAVKLSGFDVCFRAGPMGYRPVDEIIPNAATIENIRTMVNRALIFFGVYGEKVLDGFTFDGGYTDIVSTGDGDFMTNNTLWDFKVSKTLVKKEHTLQLLMYWRMGLHSIYQEFQSVKYLGVYNPRLNNVYRIATKDIPLNIIETVESEVIGYKE